MSYRGRIINGMAVLDSPGAIPDGTLVRVEVEGKLNDFWKNHTLEELAHEQGVRPLESADELVGDWPEEESIDEFLQTLREIRK